MAKKDKKKEPEQRIMKEEDVGVLVPGEEAAGLIVGEDVSARKKLAQVKAEPGEDEPGEEEPGEEEPVNEDPDNEELSLEDLQEELERLLADLVEKRKDVALHEEEKDDIARDIASLKKAIKEIAAVSESFGASFEGFQESKLEIEYYYERKSEMIEAAVAENLQEILAIIAEVDAEINAEEAEKNLLKNQFDETCDVYAEVKQHRDDLQLEYKNCVALQQQIEGKLKALDTLRKTIESEEEKNRFANMYYLIDSSANEDGMGSILEELNQLFGILDDSITPTTPPITIPDIDITSALGYSLSELQQSINEAEESMRQTLTGKWFALYPVEKETREREREMNRAKEKYELSEKRLLTLYKNRRSKILEKLTAIKI